MEQIHYHMSYKSGVISILKCQIFYHGGDYEKIYYTLFLNLRGPCFRVVKHTPFRIFCSSMGVLVLPQVSPPGESVIRSGTECLGEIQYC